jgi:hypothetical protein
MTVLPKTPRKRVRRESIGLDCPRPLSRNRGLSRLPMGKAAGSKSGEFLAWEGGHTPSCRICRALGSSEISRESGVAFSRTATALKVIRSEIRQLPEI